MLRILLLAFTLALLTPRAEAAASDKPGTLTLWLQAELEIGADGRVASLQWKDKRDSMRLVTGRLEPHVRSWTFEPGQVDGVPQRTRTFLTMQVLAEAAGDSVALRLGSVGTGARTDRMAGPRYPVAAMRAGDVAGVVAVVRVDPEGRAKVESMDYRGNRARYRSEFLKAVEDSILRSTFAQERVGDRVVASYLRIPFEFCVMDRCPEPIPATSGAEAAQAPAGQAVALESAVRLLDDVSGLSI